MKYWEKNKKIILTILGIALLFGLNSIYQTYIKANPNIKYDIVEIEKKDIKKTISVDGEVVSDYEVLLASEIPGIISKIYVKEGDYVKKGQLLMKLKDTDYKNQVNSAYAAQKINEVAYEKTKNPNHNLDLDKKIIEDSRDSVLANIEKTKSDIQSQIDILEINLSQILRMEIDDYFDHTEFDDGYNANPAFTYRLKSNIEIERLEKQRKQLGLDFKKYQDSKKTLENSIDIIDKIDKMVFNLYKNSQDFLGFSNSELEKKEKYLSDLRSRVLGYKNSLIALEAQLETLQKQLDSNFESEKKIENVVNPADLKLAKERITQARVQTHNAYTQLQKTYIRAPKDGIVVDIMKDEGEYAAPSSPLIKISSKNKYVEADIPEVDISKINKGTEVDIKIDAFKNKTFSGKIDFIYPEKKEVFGIVYYKVRILFSGDDWKKELILPGMSVEVNIIYESKEDVFAIERGVAKKENDKYFIYVLNQDKVVPKDKKFIKKYFENGFIGDNYIEILNKEDLSGFDIVKYINN